MSQSTLGGRYRVEARLGAGGMAEVFRGRDTTLDREVAIKILSPQFAKDPSFVERFRREAQAAARLNHPNIVGVFDTGVDDGTNYIVMEYVEGRTLADFLSSGGTLGPVKAAEIAEKVAEALTAAHAQGVVHRDIKPANVMVTRDGQVKVMDFGIARLVTGPDTVEQTAAVLGTAAYLSPEQAQGQAVDARSDLYSLGIVLYEMVTGKPPFVAESAMAVAYKHVQETPVPPSSLNKDVPPRMDAVVMRALAKNPANRYQSAGEFRDDLKRVIAGQDVEATPLLPAGAGATQVIARPQSTMVMPHPAPEPERKTWLVVLITILVLAVLGGGAYLLAQSLLGGEDKAQVKVPRVLGLTLEAATSQLENAGLTVKDPVMVKVDDTVPAGTVLIQDPTANSLIDQGGEVTLTVSRTSRTIAVPNLTGLTVDEATTALSDVGLVLGTQTTAPSDTVDVDLIVSQTPLPDAEAKKGDEVSVVISTGPAITTVSVPDVRCTSLGHAQSQLRKVGLNPVLSSETRPANPLCPNGNKVADQDPTPQTQVDAGTTVTLYLAEPAAPPS